MLAERSCRLRSVAGPDEDRLAACARSGFEVGEAVADQRCAPHSNAELPLGTLEQARGGLSAAASILGKMGAMKDPANRSAQSLC